MPETIGAFVALLLLVTPGLTFEILRERTRPKRTASPFREVTSIVLASVAFGAIALSLLWIQQRGGDGRLPDIEQLATNRSAYIHDNYDLVITGLLSQVVLATVLAAFWHYVLYNLRPGGVYSPDGIWHELFYGNANPRRERTFASVELHDGTRWRGYVKGFDRSEEGDLKYLVLWGGAEAGARLERRLPGSEVSIVLAPDWAYTVLTAEQIRSVVLSYVP